MAAAARAARLHTLRRARALGRDKALTCFTPDVRIAVVRSTAACNEALRRFEVANAGAAALHARALTASLLMACFHKGEERVMLDWQATAGDAPISRLYAESMRLGEVRGFISGPQVTQHADLPAFDGGVGVSSKADAAGAVSLMDSARAKLLVHRVLYGEATPQSSGVLCPSGNVTDDVNWFLAQSDQTPGYVHLEAAGSASAVDGAGHHTLAFAGGIFVQLLAEGDEAVLRRVVAALQAGDVTLQGAQEEGKGLADIAAALLPELSVTTDAHGRRLLQAGALSPKAPVPTTAAQASSALAEGTAPPAAQQVPLDFFCRCSRRGFLSQVGRLPREEVAAMAAELPPPTLTCQFCNEGYALTKAELLALLPAGSAGEDGATPAAAAAAGADAEAR